VLSSVLVLFFGVVECAGVECASVECASVECASVECASVVLSVPVGCAGGVCRSFGPMTKSIDSHARSG
jgi:hypothetical protein